MYKSLRPLFFQLEPERMHSLTLGLLRFVGAFPPAARILKTVFAAPKNPVTAFGLEFANPVGLAAGYDKDGLAWRGLMTLGFGHIEIGTITPLPQFGNPKPRVFRLPEDKALINRLGFPGRGADFIARRLSGKRPAGLILGANIGKNKTTPNSEAARDYLNLLKKFSPLADYLAVNVSSPNTVGLRRLQARASLEALLVSLRDERHQLPQQRPLLVKLAPDLTDPELDDSLDAILSADMDGVIVTNTTVQRSGLRSKASVETGGLSGAPLRDLSHSMLEKVNRRVNGQLPIIGVGGIMGPADAQARLDAGAALVQIYTGLVYSGPGLVKQIVRGLR